jgi:hypothetical protein
LRLKLVWIIIVLERQATVAFWVILYSVYVLLIVIVCLLDVGFLCLNLNIIHKEKNQIMICSVSFGYFSADKATRVDSFIHFSG